MLHLPGQVVVAEVELQVIRVIVFGDLVHGEGPAQTRSVGIRSAKTLSSHVQRAIANRAVGPDSTLSGDQSIKSSG